MTSLPLMACGHTAQGTDGNGDPVCVICAGIKAGAREVAATVPALTGRTARCDCGRMRPSSPDLAFFEYRGTGSCASEACRHCRYSEVAHLPEHMETLTLVGGKRRPTVVEDGRCPGYEPLTEGRDTDSFYCGHAGWD